MQSKIIYRIVSMMIVAGTLLIASCSKKDKSPAPVGGGSSDTSKPSAAVAPEKYTKKVIVEEFTGTWCGWCPRMPILLDKLHQKFPNLIVAALHNNDTFDIGTDIREVIEEKLGVTRYPGCVMERGPKIEWGGAKDYQATEDSVAKAFSKTAVLGFALNTSISGSTLNVTVKVGLGQTLSVPRVKVLLYVLEDGLVATQDNFYAIPKYKDTYKDDPYLGQLVTSPAKLVGYVHHHVVRKVLTDATGDEIPASSATKGAIYSKDYTVDISKYNAANLQIVAVAYGEDENGNLLGTYNAQVVKAGQSQQFD